ncbi:AP2 domain-containing protein, partial [Enterococcus hirae]|nr:AP2 domain-containing protein [Enterococcus hirae]
YGKIKVLKATTRRDKNRRIIWKCLCDCGNLFYCSGKYLISGGKTHCGCQRKNKIDITGKRFGRLIALKPIQKHGNSRCKWICKCNCGKYCLVQYGNLISGHTKSCSCLKKEDSRIKINGTFVESLIAKRSKNNKSGIKGVCRLNNKWIAYINLAGKRYHLGSYKKLDDAKKARKQAEKELFLPIIEKAHKYTD